MPGKTHLYRPVVEWTGNAGSAPGKADILGSSDPCFRGDGTRWSPEDLFGASVSACHQLWYLHLCANACVVVLAYRDEPVGTMIEDAEGSGRFAGSGTTDYRAYERSHAIIVLRPAVTVAAGSDKAQAISLHHDAHRMCFIANSVSCPVSIAPCLVE